MIVVCGQVMRYEAQSLFLNYRVLEDYLFSLSNLFQYFSVF